jgi:hypothetical protein
MNTKNTLRKSQVSDYRPLLLEQIKQVVNGSVSVIKQDGMVIQINLCTQVYSVSGAAEPSLSGTSP